MASFSLSPLAGLAAGSAALPPLPAMVARFPGCRSRWLVRGPGRALAVRCPSALVAALVCSRARAFGLPPLRCGRSGRLVLLPAARVAPPSWASRRAAGPWSRAFPSPPWCVPFGPPVPLPAPRAAPARQRPLF
ncbi:MAG: hypothetical protein RKO24_12945 [Candidatus Competibacter sp.]|nr:hypothetical protein [Candidatus Competibacter sp.]